jgi:hypothetical protein
MSQGGKQPRGGRDLLRMRRSIQRRRAARLLVYGGALVLLLAAGIATTAVVTPAFAGSGPDGSDESSAVTILIPSITTVTIPIPQPPTESAEAAEQVTSTGVTTVAVQATTVTQTVIATTTVVVGSGPAVPDRPGRARRPSPPPPPAPGRVTRLSAKPGDHRVTLTWVLPTSPSFAYVVVSRSRARGSGSRTPAARELVVYQGRRRRFVDRHLKNDVVYRYVVVAVSTSGSTSPGVAVLARPSLRALAAPAMNARVSSPPLLRWAPTRRATYYNVQLFLGKQKLLSLWPSEARLQLRASWKYAGKTYRLGKGRYTWYVWPGFGVRSKPKYGPLLGQSTFVVVP